MILDEIVADKREQLFRDKQKTDLTVMRTLAEEKLREEAAKKDKKLLSESCQRWTFHYRRI